MKKLVFVSYLPAEYSRSGVLHSALKWNNQLDIETYNLESLRLAQIINYGRFLQNLRHEEQLVIVMSPAHALVPITKLFFNGNVILDAGWPLSDSSVIRRGKLSLSYLRDLVIDRISMWLSDLVILESEAQRKVLEKRRFKFKELPAVIYTGVKEDRFQKAINVPSARSDNSNKHRFKVIFRGKFNSESGLEYIQEVFSKRLDFFDLVIVSSNLPTEFPRLHGIHYVSEEISDLEISELLRSTDLAIAQFGLEERISISIPHKIYEYSFFGLPTICLAESASREIFSDSEFFYLSREKLGQFLDLASSNPEDFSKDLKKRTSLVYKRYFEMCSEEMIAKKFVELMGEFETTRKTSHGSSSI